MPTTDRHVLRVTDATPRAELAELLAEANHAAQRDFPKVGTPEHPTPWDDSHAFINELLTDWQKAPA